MQVFFINATGSGYAERIEVAERPAGHDGNGS